jgi:LCP family protein required for cell wall assembly
MRDGLRLTRRLLGAVVLMAVLAGVFAYTVYAANGIFDEVEARERRQDNDKLIVQTATALTARLTQVADAALTPAPSLTQIAPTTEVPPSATVVAQVATATFTVAPSATHTDRPTETPSPDPSVTLIPTNTPRPSTATLIPTNTLRPSITPTPSDTATPTQTATPTLTPTPSLTFTPSVTPTATYVIEGTYAIPVNTPVVEIPPRMPLMEDDDEIVNILLLGSDTSVGGIGRTDVLIVVSINKRANSVAMWHLPRDLFVYIPNHTMDRLNLAFALGVQAEYPGGGFGLMKETFLYNFGIELDHYARVDFTDFMTIVEELGGLEVSVDCSIEDWRLISPELDPTVEENWERFTMPIGRQKLDPYMALWYVRSRQTTNDLDRGRRQMEVLRAMWQQARQQGLFEQVTELWPQAAEIVDTDMTLTDVLEFVPLAMELDLGHIARYSGTRGEHYIPFVTPDDGRDVSLPDREKLMPLIQNFLTPPTENRLGRQAVTIEVADATAWNIGFDLVATDRLGWEGFSAAPVGQEPGLVKDLTVIYDYTGQTKGSALDDLKRILRVQDAEVVSQPDPNRTFDFRVEVGRAYGYNSCLPGNAEDEIDAGPPVDEAQP